MEIPVNIRAYPKEKDYRVDPEVMIVRKISDRMRNSQS
jgi:hypothetical protein